MPTHPLSPEQPTYGYRPADTGAPPAVSIVTPYYNTGALFLETVQCVLRQSLQQWEWLIINDGSSDTEALRALLPLRSADPRIRVIDQPNQGYTVARNRGAAIAQAPLLFFLDSDDLIAPTALEKLAWMLAGNPDCAFAGAWSVSFEAEHMTWPRGFGTRHAFPYDNMPVVASLIRRDVFEGLGGFDTRRTGLEDWELWARAAASGHWGRDLREHLIWIRHKARAAY